VPLAIGLGMLAVRYRNRFPDRMINVVSLAAISLPEFFVGYILILFIAVQGGWLTFPSTVYAGMPFGQRMEAIVLPCATLVLVVLAHMMRMTRAAILNVMQSAYVETAELKGLGTLRIIARHAFPNAIAPIVNVVMLNLAYLVVGVVVVEVVFVYPGMGQYLVDARDQARRAGGAGLRPDLRRGLYRAEPCGRYRLDPRQPAAEAPEMRWRAIPISA
jgi:peptide/nickel transport system permease protein